MDNPLSSLADISSISSSIANPNPTLSSYPIQRQHSHPPPYKRHYYEIDSCPPTIIPTPPPVLQTKLVKRIDAIDAVFPLIPSPTTTTSFPKHGSAFQKQPLILLIPSDPSLPATLGPSPTLLSLDNVFQPTPIISSNSQDGALTDVFSPTPGLFDRSQSNAKSFQTEHQIKRPKVQSLLCRFTDNYDNQSSSSKFQLPNPPLLLLPSATAPSKNLSRPSSSLSSLITPHPTLSLAVSTITPPLLSSTTILPLDPVPSTSLGAAFRQYSTHTVTTTPTVVKSTTPNHFLARNSEQIRTPSSFLTTICDPKLYHLEDSSAQRHHCEYCQQEQSRLGQDLHLLESLVNPLHADLDPITSNPSDYITLTQSAVQRNPSLFAVGLNSFTSQWRRDDENSDLLLQNHNSPRIQSTPNPYYIDLIANMHGDVTSKRIFSLITAASVTADEQKEIQQLARANLAHQQQYYPLTSDKILPIIATRLIRSSQHLSSYLPLNKSPNFVCLTCMATCNDKQIHYKHHEAYFAAMKDYSPQSSLISTIELDCTTTDRLTSTSSPFSFKANIIPTHPLSTTDITPQLDLIESCVGPINDCASAWNRNGSKLIPNTGTLHSILSSTPRVGMQSQGIRTQPSSKMQVGPSNSPSSHSNPVNGKAYVCYVCQISSPHRTIHINSPSHKAMVERMAVWYEHYVIQQRINPSHLTNSFDLDPAGVGLSTTASLPSTSLPLSDRINNNQFSPTICQFSNTDTQQLPNTGSTNIHNSQPARVNQDLPDNLLTPTPTLPTRAYIPQTCLQSSSQNFRPTRSTRRSARGDAVYNETTPLSIHPVSVPQSRVRYRAPRSRRHSGKDKDR